MAVVDVIHFLGGRDRQAAHDLYDHLKRLTDAHNEAELREEQAKAVLNLANAYCRVADLVNARALYDELLDLAPAQAPAWPLALQPQQSSRAPACSDQHVRDGRFRGAAHN